MSAEQRCHICDRPLPWCEADARSDAFCSIVGGVACEAKVVDWRTRALAAEAEAERLRGVVEAAKEWLGAYDTFRDALEEGARPNGDQSLGGDDFDAFNARVVMALATLRSALIAAGER